MSTPVQPDPILTTKSPRRWSHLWSVALLLVMALSVVFERVHTWAEPPEFDICDFAIIGHEMLRGRQMYTDLWDRKPPLLYATYAMAEKLVGYGPREVLLLNILTALGIMAGCYAAGRAAGGQTGGLFAAALWVLVGGDPFMQANQPNGEVFVNTALTAAVALLLRKTAPRWRTGIGVGVLFTIASMFEQHTIIICGTLACGYLIAGGAEQLRTRLTAMSIAAGVGATAWGALTAYFAMTGALPAAYNVLFHQLFNDVSLWHSLASGLSPLNLFPSIMAWAVGPALLVLLAFIYRRNNFTPGWPWQVWTGWAVGVWFVITLPGWFFPHYYQLWMPPLCVAGGWASARLLGASRLPRAVAFLVIAVIFAFLAARELPPYRWPAIEWANRKYRQDPLGEAAYLGHRLDSLLRPDEQFWVLGLDNTVYFASERSPVTGLLYLPMVLETKNPQYLDRLMNDLHRTRPAMVVVCFPWDHWLAASYPIVPWLHENYILMPTNLTCISYDLWVRKDAANLQQRLLNPPPAPPFRRATWASEGRATNQTRRGE